MKKTLILIVSLFVLITIIVILGNVITIGEKMTAVFGIPYLEYVFYILLFAVLLYLVLYPLYRIHSAPEFPVMRVSEQESGMPAEDYEKELFSFARRICNNCYYLPEQKRRIHQAALLQELSVIKEQKDIDQLKSFLKKEIDVRMKGVDRRIMNYSSKVFIITAISQSDRFDALTTLIMNYRMIDDIIRASGFRPTRTQLIRQYVRILSAAFLSYFVSSAIHTDGLELSLGDADDVSDSLADVDINDIDITDADLADFDLADIDPSNVDFSKIMKSIKIPGIAIDSILEGISNTIMTLRIGYVTKSYLQKGTKELKGVKGAQVRKEATKSALKQFPVLLAEIPQRIGSGVWTKVLSLISKIYTAKANEMNDGEQAKTDVAAPKKKGFFSFLRHRL